MKKFLKVLTLLIILIIGGIIAFFYFINPNQYKGYLVQQVEQKTGYKLEINGDLRWHILPKISVSANDVVVTAPDASSPIVSADDMRLDIELIPLFSKKLQVEQIILDTAQVKLSEKTLPINQELINNPPGIRKNSTTSQQLDKNKNQIQYGEMLKQLLAQFQISKFQISNSQVTLQLNDNEENLFVAKDIDLLLERKSTFVFNLQNRANIELNKQHYFIDLSANIDMKSLPEHISIMFSKLDYKINDADMALNGALTGDVQYALDKQNAQVALKSLTYQLTLPSMTLTGASNLSADYDMVAQKINVNIPTLSYLIKGSSFVNSGIDGNLQLTANYDLEKQNIQINQIKADANKNTITGTATINLEDVPAIKLDLASTMLNLDKILANENNKSVNSSKKNIQQPTKAEVTKANIQKSSGNDLAFLRNIKAELTLKIASLVINGMNATNINVHLNNVQGKTQIKTLSASLLGGKISVPGTLNATGKQPFIAISPKIEKINWEDLNNAFQLPKFLVGLFSMNGNLSGYGLDNYSIIKNWKGNFSLQFDNAKLQNLNIEQIINQVASMSKSADKVDKNYEKYTEFKQLNASAALQSGVLNLNSLQLESKALNVTGVGSVGLEKMACDFNLKIKLLQDIGSSNKKQQLSEILKKTVIPMRIYGDCTNLSYKLDIDKLLQDRVKAEAKEQATKLIDKYLDKEKSEDIKSKSIDKVLSRITGGK